MTFLVRGKALRDVVRRVVDSLVDRDLHLLYMDMDVPISGSPVLTSDVVRTLVPRFSWSAFWQQQQHRANRCIVS